MKMVHRKWLGFLALLVFSTLPTLAIAGGATTETIGGRAVILYTPSTVPPPGSRALVVVLHGGLGNATRIKSGGSEHPLNMDPEAERHGFLVVYLNGTPVARLFGRDKEGWNAGGGCCGLPAQEGVNDVGYVKNTVAYLVATYGIDPHRVYGMGHSNGAMLTQRLMCETDLYAAAVAVSGPLNLNVSSCPAACGKRILAIHGTDDANVPVAGGRGSEGWSRATYQSEERSRSIFTASGATYDLHLVTGADHAIEHIDAAMRREEGISIPDAAAHFFGLEK